MKFGINLQRWSLQKCVPIESTIKADVFIEDELFNVEVMN